MLEEVLDKTVIDYNELMEMYVIECELKSAEKCMQVLMREFPLPTQVE